MQYGHCFLSIRSGKGSGPGDSSFTITSACTCTRALRRMRSGLAGSRLPHRMTISSAARIRSSRSSAGLKLSGWLQRISASCARSGICRSIAGSTYSSCSSPPASISQVGRL